MTPFDVRSLRILLLTPVGRDASLIGDVLAKDGFEGVACRGVDDLAVAIDEGAAAAIVAEEALVGVPLDRLLAVEPREVAPFLGLAGS